MTGPTGVTGTGATGPTGPTGSSGGSTVAIAQTSHGFSVGNVLRLSGTTYVLAKADTAADAEVAGIVASVVDANNFTLATGGYVTGLSGITGGTVYFLSPSSGGAITSSQPSTPGLVSKPVLIADSTSSGYFVNWRGEVIGGATTQPTLLNIQVLTATGPANQTYTPTAGTTSFLAELIGGGGGGGNGLNTAANNSRRWRRRRRRLLLLLQQRGRSQLHLLMRCGRRHRPNATGTAGNNTIFGNTWSNCAYGNTGGGGGGGFEQPGGAGGGAAAGGAGGTPNTGLLKMAGGHGEPGFHAGNNVAQVDIAVGGLGGDSPRGGIGGAGGRLSIQAAVAGGNYGAGGGGGASNNSTAAARAAGAQGVIIVYEYS